MNDFMKAVKLLEGKTVAKVEPYVNSDEDTEGIYIECTDGYSIALVVNVDDVDLEVEVL